LLYDVGVDETPSATQPKLVRPPEFDTCQFYTAAVHLLFVPKRVLLRRLFFIDDDRTKYVSVGVYPAPDNRSFVELRSVNKKMSTILILDDQQFNKMADSLPKICESMCGFKQYGWKEGNF